MALADPIQERIAQAIEVEIDAITAGATYEISIAGVDRPTRKGGLMVSNLRAVLEVGARARVKELDTPGSPSGLAWIQTFAITVWVLEAPDAGYESFDTYKAHVAADVEVALMADPTHGSLAIDSDLSGFVPWAQFNESDDGITVFTEVLYRVSETDPRTQIT